MILWPVTARFAVGELASWNTPPNADASLASASPRASTGIARRTALIKRIDATSWEIHARSSRLRATIRGPISAVFFGEARRARWHTRAQHRITDQPPRTPGVGL